MLKMICQHSSMKLMSYAWNISRWTLQRIVKQEVSGLTLARRIKKDKGLTLFNSEQKRNQYITARSTLNRAQPMIHHGSDPLTPDQLFSSWMSMTKESRQRYEDLAEDNRRRCSTMIEDIREILKRTKGSITWQQLASSLCGIGIPYVSHVTIANNIMRLPQSSYRTTTIFPSLDKATIKRRLAWGLNFWKFWQTAKNELTSTKVLLCHMDEKWFYSIVVRKKNKYIPFLGMEEKSVSHQVQHKLHIQKHMYICTTAYLPHGNNITAGGLSYKVTMERVGKKMPAKRNSYKRVYNDDNTTFTYPQVESNILRRKGEMYFQSLEVNATKEGTVSNPKYSLKKFFLEKEIPSLEALTRQLTESYNQKVVVRYQMDSAGPHTDRILLEILEEEFLKREWMLVRQPPQSPLTNVKDTCIFRSLSKEVSWHQADLYNNKMLDGEELHNCVSNAYNNLPVDTIARAYLGHHQMVNAIVHDNGADHHMKERGGLHCGVRRNSVILYDNEEGVTPIGIFVAEEEVGESVEEQARVWKYRTPDVSQRNILLLNKTERHFLEKNLPVDSHLLETVAAYNLCKYENETYSD